MEYVVASLILLAVLAVGVIGLVVPRRRRRGLPPPAGGSTTTLERPPAAPAEPRVYQVACPAVLQGKVEANRELDSLDKALLRFLAAEERRR